LEKNPRYSSKKKTLEKNPRYSSKKKTLRFRVIRKAKYMVRKTPSPSCLGIPNWKKSWELAQLGENGGDLPCLGK
jgi:hypothetical protein